MHFAMPYWKNWEDMADATYKIIDNNVALTPLRVPPDCLNWFFTESNDAFCDAFHKGALPVSRKDHLHHWQTIIAGYSDKSSRFKKKVFSALLRIQAGIVYLTPDQEELLFSANVRVSYIPRVFRPSETLVRVLAWKNPSNSWGNSTGQGKAFLRSMLMGEDFRTDGPEGWWAWLNEGRSLHSENAWAVFIDDPTAMAAARQFIFESISATNLEGLGVQILPGYVGPFADMMGPENLQRP